MQAQERLYLTEKKDTLVREGDKRARFLYAVPGDEIPNETAEKFGLKEGKLPSNKEAKGGENKGQ